MIKMRNISAAILNPGKPGCAHCETVFVRDGHEIGKCARCPFEKDYSLVRQIIQLESKNITRRGVTLRELVRGRVEPIRKQRRKQGLGDA